MQHHDLSLDAVLKIADAAKKHARDKIKKGYTQIENNDLSETYYLSLRQAVTDIRSDVTEKVKTRATNISLEDTGLQFFQQSVETSEKYSLGNCRELAILALDYVLNNTQPEFNAEVYQILGGDHAFLVINRKPISNPQDPATWGDNAVICDPWSNKVYLASEYLSELKNFYNMPCESNTQRRTNHTEDFNPNIHTLAQYRELSTINIRQMRTIDTLKVNFNNEIQYIIDFANTYISSLETEMKRLCEKYGDADLKTKAISNKMENISETIQALVNDSQQYLVKDYNGDYQAAKSDLSNAIIRLNKSTVIAMQFSPSELRVLLTHKGKDTKTELMKFFGVKSNTHKRIEKVFDDVNKKIHRS